MTGYVDHVRIDDNHLVMAAHRHTERFLHALSTMPIIGHYENILQELDHNLRHEFAVMEDLFDCAPIVGAFYLNSRDIGPDARTDLMVQMGRVIEHNPDENVRYKGVMMGESFAKARRDLVERIFRGSAMSAIRQVASNSLLTRMPNLGAGVYDDVLYLPQTQHTPRLRNMVQHVSGLPTPGLNITVRTILYTNGLEKNNNAVGTLRFEPENKTALKDFAPLFAAQEIIARDKDGGQGPKAVLTIEQAANLVVSLSNNGILQECFEARRKRIGTPVVSKVRSSFDEIFAKANGAFRTHSRYSMSDYWLTSGPWRLYMNMAYDQPGPSYGAWRKPMTMLLNSATDLAYNSARQTGSLDFEPLRIVMKALAPMVRDTLAAAPRVSALMAQRSTPALAAE